MYNVSQCHGLTTEPSRIERSLMMVLVVVVMRRIVRGRERVSRGQKGCRGSMAVGEGVVRGRGAGLIREGLAREPV